MDLDQHGDGPDVLEHGTDRADRPGRRWSRWAVLALAAVVALVLVVRLDRRDPTPPAASPSAGTTGTTAAPEPSAAPSESGPVVAELGSPLLDGAAGWEVFVRGVGVVARVEPARGRVTVTPLPALASGGPTAFLAGPAGAIVRPLDYVTGYAVSTGGVVRPLAGRLADGGPVVPGPDPGTVWVQEENRLSLVGADGRFRDLAVDLPRELTGPPLPDGAGYPLYSGPGGSYSVRPDGVHRLTTGVLLAAGPTRLLVRECDERFHCTALVVDRRTGARHPLPLRMSGREQSSGTVSPDGTRAALLVADPARGSAVVHLIDLRNGADRPTKIEVDQRYADGGEVAWSPDSRWLLAVASDGTLCAIDPVSGADRRLPLDLPPLEQLAVRKSVA